MSEGGYKVLFLDVDGVLNCAKSNFNGNGFPIDPYMAILVDRIIQATGCKVVLSSSWRFHPEGMEEVSKFIPLIDKTPNLPGTGFLRGHEIEYWLNHNEYLKCDNPTSCPKGTRAMCNGHKIEKYAILDDNSDMLEHQLPNFFQTRWTVGLTEEISKNVINHFNS